jgi:mannose/fructose/N-acetylgalactosamine-specific phosphotransferase system component IIB
VQGGIALEELQIGGLGGGPGKVQVYKGIAVDKNDIEDLKQISEHGTRVYFQMIPEDPTLSLEKALQNYNK